jgi:hypothetical protein
MFHHGAQWHHMGARITTMVQPVDNSRVLWITIQAVDNLG